VAVHAGCDKQDSLMPGGLCGKLHGGKSQLLSHCSSHGSDSHIFVENRDFCMPNLYSTTPLVGYPSEYCHDVCYRKTRMVWLPDGEKIEDMFIRFDRINERDRQTDRRIDRQTPHDSIGRAYA